MVEALQPSERKDLLSALAAVDTALQGENWEQALALAEEIRAAQRRLEHTFGRSAWAASPCVRILTIDGGGIRGVILPTPSQP